MQTQYPLNFVHFDGIIGCGRSIVHQKVFRSKTVNGNEVRPHSIPWHAQVIRTLKTGEMEACSGSLINSRNVLSPAQCTLDTSCNDMNCCKASCMNITQDEEKCKKCIDERSAFNTKPDMFTVILGQHESNCDENCYGQKSISTDGMKFAVCSVSIHKSIMSVYDFLSPLSEKRFDNDFAIFWLTFPVSNFDNIAPVCLPTPNMDVKFLQEELLTASGWRRSTEKAVYVLNSLKLPGVPSELCTKAHLDKTLYTVMVPYPNITRNMFCAGYKNEQEAICGGDRGGTFIPRLIYMKILGLQFDFQLWGIEIKIQFPGPLTYDDGGSEVLVGIMSWRLISPEYNPTLPNTPKQGCKQNGTFPVFGHVTPQLQWIEEEINQEPDTCQF